LVLFFHLKEKYSLKGFMFNEDTICAISTPTGMGGIGIVRVSGPDAVGLAAGIFVPAVSRVGDKLHSHQIIYGNVVNPVNGEVVDEALLTFMRAPRTYTREDVIEINCHGGPAAVRKVLELVMAGGARLAEPGEFTKRAFLNGRIDLTQAEAVMDVIASKTEFSLSAAVAQLKGGLKEKVEALREGVAGLLALTEVSIDFPEEEVDYVPLDELRRKGEGLRSDIGRLLSTFDEGRVLREGLRVAIVGRPNVGKSSLLNLLARAERAIVTEVPGTTRDTVEEIINIGGVPVKVIDTAGIRESHDIVEKEGIRRSEEALRSSDLALLVLDGSRPLHQEDIAIIEKANKYKYIPVINKSDLPSAIEGEVLKALFMEEAVHVSARNGDGLDGLTLRIRESALGGGREHAPEVTINLRHRESLRKAEAALVRFDEGCGAGLSAEFLALELRDALNAVGDIVGATTPEDILNRIFNEFCIGK